MENPIAFTTREVDMWQTAHAKARTATCTIHVAYLLPVGTWRFHTGQGTGTLVDKTRGLVLTNRHVLGVGPSWGYAVLGGIQYRIERVFDDPIHDFAIVQLLKENGDVPKDLPEQIDLRPDLAHQGCGYCTVSNVSGLTSNMSRSYIGRTNVNPSDGLDDFNTEYFTSVKHEMGGSSGASAVNIDGNAVGMDTASNGTIGFLLPLDLPKKALECFQRGEPVSRGTLQTKWVLLPLHECDRLGLHKSWIARFEDRKVQYLVCAKVILPGGPADQKIGTGDILLQLNGELVTSLLQVELYMDAHVNKPVTLTCWTENGLSDVECRIEDLHAINPHHLVVRQRTVFHHITLSEAIQNNIPAQGIWSAQSLETFPKHKLIETINGEPVSDLKCLVHLVDKNRDKNFVTTYVKDIKQHRNSYPYTGYFVRTISAPSLEMERQPQQGGPWVITSMLPPRSDPCLFSDIVSDDVLQDQEQNQEQDEPQGAKDMFRGMVSFRAHRDIIADGQAEVSYRGKGLILDAEQGLVVTNRGELTEFDEIMMTIAGRSDVMAKIVFLHPALDLAVLKMDITAVPKALLYAAPLANRDIQQGDFVYYASLDYLEQYFINTTVENIDEDWNHGVTGSSSFKPFCHTTCQLRHVPEYIMEGVLFDSQYAVVGLIYHGISFIPRHALRSVIEQVKMGRIANLRFRDFDAARTPLSDAFRQGLDQKWSKEITNNQILPELGFQYENPTLRVLFFRNGQEVEVEVPTLSVHDVSTNQVVNFCGAWLQKSSLSARMTGSPIYSEVHVTARMFGSPADLYDLPISAFIIEVDGVKVFTMSEFLQCVRKTPFEQYIRIKCVLTTQQHHVLTIKKSYLFPTRLWSKCPSSTTNDLTVEVVEDEYWKDGQASSQPVKY
ncbi:hypothetical protein Ct61P_01684 [Colletotrichum tofieldiae]|nr:hypothetical protein Ct61P_01684 [Colletotrichum tofieldiae]